MTTIEFSLKVAQKAVSYLMDVPYLWNYLTPISSNAFVFNDDIIDENIEEYLEMCGIDSEEYEIY